MPSPRGLREGTRRKVAIFALVIALLALLASPLATLAFLDLMLDEMVKKAMASVRSEEAAAQRQAIDADIASAKERA